MTTRAAERSRTQSVIPPVPPSCPKSHFITFDVPPRAAAGLTPIFPYVGPVGYNIYYKITGGSVCPDMTSHDALTQCRWPYLLGQVSCKFNSRPHPTEQSRLGMKTLHERDCLHCIGGMLEWCVPSVNRHCLLGRKKEKCYWSPCNTRRLVTTGNL